MPKPRKGHRFHGFSFFLKNRKIDAPRASQIDENWYKIRSGADPGGLILRFWSFMKRTNKSMILDLAPAAPKIRKIGPKSDREAPNRPRNFAGKKYLLFIF